MKSWSKKMLWKYTQDMMNENILLLKDLKEP